MENEGQSQPATATKVVEVKTEEEFAQFIRAYAMSFGANHFLNDMEPNQRVRFFVTVSKTYPNEWKEAIILLANEEPQIIP